MLSQQTLSTLDFLIINSKARQQIICPQLIITLGLNNETQPDTDEWLILFQVHIIDSEIPFTRNFFRQIFNSDLQINFSINFQFEF